MPYIENVLDLVENIADWVGVWGGHDDSCGTRGARIQDRCRVCFTDELEHRIRSAVDNEHGPAIIPQKGDAEYRATTAAELAWYWMRRVKVVEEAQARERLQHRLTERAQRSGNHEPPT